tara:strand:- start:178 stop:711 length:534 start_codon:yes stop_codon:yes gene_type:complete
MAKDSKTAKRYARAIFELALDENNFDDWLEKLNLICESAKNREFNMILDSSKVTVETKFKLIDQVFGSSFGKLQLNFVKLLSKNQSFLLIDEIYNQFEYEYEKQNNKVRVLLSSPYKIDDNLKNKITEVAKTISGSDPQIEEKIDKSLIGGIVIKIGDSVIDGSLKNKLKQLKRELV